MTEAKKDDTKKLVKNGDTDSLNLSDFKNPSVKLTNKHTRLHQTLEPRIRPHIVRGKEYYFFCQGDKEIYLGSAENILCAVREQKGNGG